MTVTESRRPIRGTRLGAVLVGCALAGASALIAAPAHADPSGPVHLDGTVTAGGAPAQGVDVWLERYVPENDYWSDVDDVDTAGDGSWSLDESGLPAGTYTLYFGTGGSSAVYSASQFLGGAVDTDIANGAIPQTVLTIAADGTVSSAPAAPIAAALTQTQGAVAVAFVDAASGARITGPADDSSGSFDVSASITGTDAKGAQTWATGSASASSTAYTAFDGTLVIGHVEPGSYYQLAGSLDDERSGTPKYHDGVSFISVTVPAAGQQAAATLPLTALPAGQTDPAPSSVSTLLPALSPVHISGDAKVGSALTAVVPATTASVSYQWTYADMGTPIAGATGSTLIVPASALGHLIGVSVIFSKAGYGPVLRGATLYSAVTAGTTIPGTVSVKGTAAFGKTLTASVASLPAGSHAYGYQWLRAGKAIAGATRSTYTVQAADVAQKLSVVASVTAQGFADGKITAAKTVTVKKDTPKVTAVVSGKPKAGAKVTVTVTVAGPSKIKGAGKVKISYTKSKSKTVSLNSKTGKVKVVLPAYAKKGSYTVKLSYAGSSKYDKATGKVVVKVAAKTAKK